MHLVGRSFPSMRGPIQAHLTFGQPSDHCQSPGCHFVRQLLFSVINSIINVSVWGIHWRAHPRPGGVRAARTLDNHGRLHEQPAAGGCAAGGVVAGVAEVSAILGPRAGGPLRGLGHCAAPEAWSGSRPMQAIDINAPGLHQYHIRTGNLFSQQAHASH